MKNSKIMEELSEDDILKGLKNKLAKLRKEDKEAIYVKNQRDSQIERLTKAIDAFIIPVQKTTSIDSVAGDNGEFIYPKEESWSKRIISFIKYHSKAVTISELVEGIKPYERTISEDKLHGSISNRISDMVKKKDIIAYKPKKMKGYFYASPIWFENGEIKEEYKPIEKEVSLW